MAGILYLIELSDSRGLYPSRQSARMCAHDDAACNNALRQLRLHRHTYIDSAMYDSWSVSRQVGRSTLPLIIAHGKQS